MYAKKICNVLIELGILSLIIFPPIVLGAVQLRYVTYIHIIILSIGIIWIVKTFIKGSFFYSPTPFDLPILFFLLIGIVNLLTSTYRHNTERELYLFINYALLYFLVVQQLKTVRRIIGLAFIIVLVGSGESLFGLFQYLQGAKTVLGYQTPNIGTLNATYFNHNHFAGFLILIIPIALGLLIGTSNLEKKFFIFLLIGLMGTALLLTLSRGGLLSLFLALGGFIMVFVSKGVQTASSRHKFLLLIVLLILCVAVYVAWIGISPIAHRSLRETVFPTGKTFGQEIRFSLWRNALALLKEFPVFGSGLGTFEYVFLRYRPEELPQDLQAFYAHNDYLELLLEMGFPALLLAIWAILRFYRYSLKGYFHHQDPVLTALTLGGLTSSTAMFIHSFFDFNLQIPANALLFFIVLALTTSTVQVMTRGNGKRRKRNSQPKSAGYQVKTSWKFGIVMVCMLALLVVNFRQDIALTFYSKAKTLQMRHHLLEAIQGYQKAITVDSSNALFRESLGELYSELGKQAPHSDKWYQLAIQEYQQAIALNAYNPLYYYKLGRTYAMLDMEREAVQAFQTAITYNPRISFYYENLGKYYLSFERVDLAMQEFRKAVQIDSKSIGPLLEICKKWNLSYESYQQFVPEDAENRKIFAALLAQQQLWEESKEEYRKAIELSGKQQEYYDTMINACQNHHDDQCMRTLWQELWEQDPQNLDFPMQIAENFARQQMWDQAIALYQELVQEHPENTELLQRLAQLYQQNGHNKKALQVYKQLLTVQKNNTALYHKIAAIYRQQRDWKAAITVYKNALEEGLTQAEIYSNLGKLYLQINDKKSAVEMFDQAVQTGETRIAIYKQLEQMYQAQNNGVALDLLWATYALANKHNPDALFQLVQHYHTHGEWLKAVTLSKEVIANAPTNATYRSFLANLYEQQQMLYEAIDQWEKIVKFHSENIEYKLHLAMLYEKVNQWDHAKTQYRKILRIQPNNRQAKQRLSSLEG